MLIRFILLVNIIIGSLCASAQSPDSVILKPKYWTFKGASSLQFNQIKLTNWAAGGQSSISFLTSNLIQANFNKGRSRWENKLALDFGVIKVEDLEFRKNMDIFNFTTSYGYKLDNRLRINAFSNLLTQMAPGYNYQNDPNGEDYVSNFFAPAFLQQGIGLEYSRDSLALTVSFSPVAVKSTFILDRGVNPHDYGVDSGKTSRHELGAFLKASFIREIMKNILVATDLTLFSNYLEDPQEVDVIWQTKVDIVANKYITVSISTHLIWDNDILIPKFEDINGDGIAEKTGERPAVQFKEAFGVGLSYKF